MAVRARVAKYYYDGSSGEYVIELHLGGRDPLGRPIVEPLTIPARWWWLRKKPKRGMLVTVPQRVLDA